MAMGRQKDGQGDLMVSWSEMPRSPGHVCYDRLQPVLIEGGFDAFAEASCRPYYAARMGAPSVPPGRYFRMHLVGHFEGIDSERGLEWRCSDSLSLRAFLRLGSRDRVPDHSWLSRSRTRLPHEVHATVLRLGSGANRRGGADQGRTHRRRCLDHGGPTRRCGTSCGATTAKATGRCWSAWPGKAASRTPTAEDLARLDRKRKGKKLSNTDWVSKGRPRGQDRQDAGRHDASGLQAPSTRWIWTPARWWRPSCTRPMRATPRRFSKTLVV